MKISNKLVISIRTYITQIGMKRPKYKHINVEITSADSSGIEGVCKDCSARLNGSAPMISL